MEGDLLIMRCTGKLILLLSVALLPGSASAGQSLVLTPSTPQITLVDPVYPANKSYRIELQIHNWTLAAAGGQPTIFSLTGLAAAASLWYDGRVALGSLTDVTVERAPCFVSTNGLTNALIRFQKDVANMRYTCEIWNYDGTGYGHDSDTISTLANFPFGGGTIGGGVAASLGFLRVYTTVVPLGSRAPVTADRADYTDLKFDGDLSDSSGNGHGGNPSPATFAATPNQVPVALPKVLGAPFWTNWVSLRAGFPSRLDGTPSFSLADSSSSVSYLWRQVSGPSTVIWSNRTSATPAITGLIFGTYIFSLQVTDVAGNSAVVTLQTGAVAYDSNGVVIPPDPKVANIFGPQIAFGQNPWGYQDERNLYAINAQMQFQASAYDSGWTTPGQGTVSYPFAGKGFAPGPACTTLSAGIAATDMSIPVANASCLSLNSLPTWILIGTANNNTEMMRICSASATSGAATLTVCYDGRGVSGNTPIMGGWVNTVPAQAWSSGASVGELRIQGSGTLFSSDANRAMCPAGVPGPPGLVAYSGGTITLSPGSSTVVGGGTNWTTGNGVKTNGFIRVTATHDNGTPFVFWAQIVTVTDSTHLVVNRPAPSGVDPTAFSYKITSPPMILSLELTYTDGHIARMLFNSVGCESETAMFAMVSHDVVGLNDVVMSGVKYSYKRFLTLYSTTGTNTSNFYGVGMAARNFYYRSGYAPALALANAIDEQAVRDPEIGDGLIGGTPLALGGTALGGFIDLVLNPSTVLTWPNVEQFALHGELGSQSCNSWDSRDGGYLTAWLTMAANYDTNSTNRVAFQSALRSVLTRDQFCKRNASDGYIGAQVNSFAHSFLWIPSVPLTLTNGSTAVSGAGFTPQMCSGTFTGTISVTHGSASATLLSGTLGNSDVRINIADTISNPVYVGGFQYSVAGTAVSLAGIWPGATGTFTFMSEGNANQGWISSIWTDNTDNLANNSALSKPWACIYNSPSSLTLNRPWDAASGSNYHLTSYTVGAFGQQPFMLGVKTNQMRWASVNDDPTISSGYAAILPLVGNWMATYGMDSNTKGTFYDRVFGLCEPSVAAAGSFFTITGWDPASGQLTCGASGVLGTETERANSAEAGSAMIQYYLANPTPAAKATVDQYYGGVFGNCLYATGGVYCDSNYVNFLLSNPLLGGSKWPGFFFGMGGLFSSSWPAVRNGVQPASMRAVSIDFNLGRAASARITVTAPSGSKSIVQCSAAPCAITVDDRQGSHWYAIQYLSASGQVLSTSAPVLLPLAP